MLSHTVAKCFVLSPPISFYSSITKISVVSPVKRVVDAALLHGTLLVSLGSSQQSQQNFQKYRKAGLTDRFSPRGDLCG